MHVENLGMIAAVRKAARASRVPSFHEFATRSHTRRVFSTDHVLTRLDERPILKKVMSLGNVGLILLSALPIRGFGILSASIVSFFLKKGRMEGTVLLMTGSFIGIFIIMGIAKGIFKIIALF